MFDVGVWTCIFGYVSAYKLIKIYLFFFTDVYTYKKSRKRGGWIVVYLFNTDRIKNITISTCTKSFWEVSFLMENWAMDKGNFKEN